MAETEAGARELLAEYARYGSPTGALALKSGWTGVDFAPFPPGTPVRHVENDAGRTALDNVTRADPARVWTVGEVAEHVAIGGFGPVLAGTPTHVAGILEEWVEEADLDGFNLAFALRPESMQGVVDLLVPKLQRCGRYKRSYAEGTLREKLFGPDRARLAAPHPAAAYRFPDPSVSGAGRRPL